MGDQKEGEGEKKINKGKEKEDEMRERQRGSLLPGSLSCVHICVRRV